MSGLQKFFKNEIVVVGAKLTSITLSVGLILSLMYYITSPIIDKQQEKIENADLYKLVEGADSFEEVSSSLTGLQDGVLKAYKAMKSGAAVGYVVEVSSPGYGGDVIMRVGFNKDAVLSGIIVVSHSETPGIGTKALESAYLDKYISTKGSSIEASGNNVDLISGATFSSTAVRENVNKALATVTQMSGGGVVEQKREEDITTEDNLKQAIAGSTEFVNITESITDLSMKVIGVYEAKKDGTTIGYTVTAFAMGGHGKVYMTIALDTNGAVTNLFAIKEEETEGYKEKVFNDEYLSKFIGVKGATIEDSEIKVDTVSGATLSSTAVRKCVNEALMAYAQIKG